jgi:hypothetical protein
VREIAENGKCTPRRREDELRILITEAGLKKIKNSFVKVLHRLHQPPLLSAADIFFELEK